MTSHRFFDDEGFEFLALITLGGAPYRLAETGEVFATCDRITDGDCDSWFDEWMATAHRVCGIADAAAAAGHDVSARDTFLRAANYAGTAFFYVLATSDPSRSLATWRWHRECFDAAMQRWSTPVEKITIPYEDTPLHGYFFSGGDGRRPTVILNNGSDGPISDMLEMGAIDAVARGWNALAFDGPGQGHALYEDGLFFRYDWEAVITPVVDYLLTRADVDTDRIVLSGNSQAGYWVPRAAAFEHRLAAIIVDPGVVQVSTSWTSHFPPELMQLFDAGDDSDFDTYATQGIEQMPLAARTLAKRMEPYGTSSIAAILHELSRYDLTEVAAQITCPVWISNPDDEQFWPGQSQQLFDLISHADKVLVPFTTAEGANWHCEPMAPQLRAQRAFDWLAQL